VRRLAAALLLAAGALLLTPGAVGKSNVPGDPTPPVVTPVITGTLGTNGWYVTNVTVGWSVTDPESIILSTSGCDTRTLTLDTTGVTLTCSATSDGGTTTVSKTFKVDETPPSVSAAPSRAPDANGWYNRALTVGFSGSDAMSGIAACTSGSYSGPDDGSAAVAGSCLDKAGNSAGRSFGLKYDATPPTVVATPNRSPDANGWYNHALSVAFSGRDATSGIASCSPTGYAGPDTAGASVVGGCTDVAGNVGSASLPLKYDATPPAIARVRATPAFRRIHLAWTASPDTQTVQVSRAPGGSGAPTRIVYSGSAASHLDTGLKAGASYRYTVTAFDEAGNSASKAITASPTGRLFSPLPGAHIASLPLLRWTPLRGATYYNLQLIRGRKIFSAWPASAHFRLPRAWSFQGHRYRLHRGVYRWYVWPGFGRFSAGKYGRLLGGSSFVYTGSG
jgi:hypothetical protein